ncbi:MAG: (2Fe-2S)-binding protein [Verrucomicrobiales bacterium]
MNQTSPSPIDPCRFVPAVPHEVLCHCAQVAESVVQAAVHEEGANSLEEVAEATGAGSGCRACHCRIQRVLLGLPAKCGGRFDMCGSCGCAGAICRCTAA